MHLINTHLVLRCNQHFKIQVKQLQFSMNQRMLCLIKTYNSQQLHTEVEQKQNNQQKMMKIMVKIQNYFNKLKYLPKQYQVLFYIQQKYKYCYYLNYSFLIDEDNLIIERQQNKNVIIIPNELQQPKLTFYMQNNIVYYFYLSVEKKLYLLSKHSVIQLQVPEFQANITLYLFNEYDKLYLLQQRRLFNCIDIFDNKIVWKLVSDLNEDYTFISLKGQNIFYKEQRNPYNNRFIVLFSIMKEQTLEYKKFNEQIFHIFENQQNYNSIQFGNIQLIHNFVNNLVCMVDYEKDQTLLFTDVQDVVGSFIRQGDLKQQILYNFLNTILQIMIVPSDLHQYLTNNKLCNYMDDLLQPSISMHMVLPQIRKTIQNKRTIGLDQLHLEMFDNENKLIIAKYALKFGLVDIFNSIVQSQNKILFKQLTPFQYCLKQFDYTTASQLDQKYKNMRGSNNLTNLQTCCFYNQQLKYMEFLNEVGIQRDDYLQSSALSCTLLNDYIDQKDTYLFSKLYQHESHLRYTDGLSIMMFLIKSGIYFEGVEKNLIQESSKLFVDVENNFLLKYIFNYEYPIKTEIINKIKLIQTRLIHAYPINNITQQIDLNLVAGIQNIGIFHQQISIMDLNNNIKQLDVDYFQRPAFHYIILHQNHQIDIFGRNYTKHKHLLQLSQPKNVAIDQNYLNLLKKYEDNLFDTTNIDLLQ